MSSVNVETGTEGPTHDPYGWDEVTVTRDNGNTVTIHEGFIDWIEVNGVKLPNMNYADCAIMFEHYAGISVKTAVRAYERLTTMCQKCGCRSQEAVAGHPGETFYLCCNCNAVVDTAFNLSAVI